MYQYTPYQDRSVGSIAELLARRGDIAARQAEQVGQIQGRAAEQSGNAWAGAIGNIGQMVGQIPGQMQQAKRAQMQDEMGAIQLSRAKEMQAGERATDALMKGDQLPADATGPRQQTYTNAEGLFDVPRLHQALAAQGMGHLAPELLKSAESINASITEHQQLEQKMGAASTLMLGDMADGALKLASVGMPIDAAMDFVMQPALATQRTSPERYQQIRDKITSLPPDQQQAALQSFMDAAAKLDKGKTLGKDAKEVDRYGRTTAINTVEEPNKGDYTGPDGIRYHANGTPVTGSVMKPQTAPKSIESKSVLLDGKPAIVNFNPADGTHKLPDGTDVSSRVKPIPAASIQIHNTDLAAAGKADNPVAKAIAEYRMAPPASRSLSTPGGQALMAQVMAQNPEYSADQYSRRAPMAKAFTSGPQSQAINSLNTAIGHLDQFVDVAKALDNGNFQPGNQAYNWVKTTFGDSAPTNFAGIRSIMAGELASAFKKSGATDQEIASVEKAISSKASTKQLVDYATKIAIPALGSKIATYNSQYRGVMGANDPFKVLTSDAENVLAKYGFDPAHPTMGDSGAKTAASNPFVAAPKPTANPFRK